MSRGHIKLGSNLEHENMCVEFEKKNKEEENNSDDDQGEDESYWLSQRSTLRPL